LRTGMTSFDDAHAGHGAFELALWFEPAIRPTAQEYALWRRELAS
jgi:hypothetical protein